MKRIVGIHADNLNQKGPALRAHPDVPALFVWDEELLRDQSITTVLRQLPL